MCCLFQTVLFLLLFGAASSAQAQETCLDSVCFSNQATVSGAILPLRAAARKEYLFFELYLAALYVPSTAEGIEGVLANVPKQLVIHYLRDFSAEDFSRSGRKVMAKNPNNDLEALSRRFAQVDELYQDVSAGDRYRIVYEPEKGTSFYLNNEYVGTVPGGDFARAYFGIWLSRYSIDRDLTRALVG